MARRGTTKNQPSVQRYKAENRLQKNKIRKIMKDQKVDEVEAMVMWEDSKKKKEVVTKKRG